MTHDDRTEPELDRYLDGLLDDEARDAFERRILIDDRLRAAVEYQAELDRRLNDEFGVPFDAGAPALRGLLCSVPRARSRAASWGVITLAAIVVVALWLSGSGVEPVPFAAVHAELVECNEIGVAACTSGGAARLVVAPSGVALGVDPARVGDLRGPVASKVWDGATYFVAGSVEQPAFLIAVPPGDPRPLSPVDRRACSLNVFERDLAGGFRLLELSVGTEPAFLDWFHSSTTD